MKENTDINTQDSIDLFELIRLLNQKKRFIILFTGIVTLIAIIYSLIATPYYKSYVSIYPSSEDIGLNNSSNDLKGMASAFGINIGGGSNVRFYIPDVIQSRKIKKLLILKKWRTEQYNDPVNLITYWEIDDTTKIIRRIKRFVYSLFPKRKSDPQKKYIEQALNEFNDRISIQEEDSGLFSIYLYMEEPQLAADIINYVSLLLKKYISDELEIQSTEYRQFIETRMEESINELSNSEERLTEFRKKHPKALDTPELQLERGRFKRNVEVNQQLYITLRQQFELARIEELKEKPVINILDEGEAAVEKAKPRRTKIVLITFVISLVFSLYIAYFRERAKMIGKN